MNVIISLGSLLFLFIVPSYIAYKYYKWFIEPNIEKPNEFGSIDPYYFELF